MTSTRTSTKETQDMPALDQIADSLSRIAGALELIAGSASQAPALAPEPAAPVLPSEALWAQRMDRDGWSTAEIAAVLGASETAVRLWTGDLMRDIPAAVVDDAREFARQFFMDTGRLPGVRVYKDRLKVGDPKATAIRNLVAREFAREAQS